MSTHIFFGKGKRRNESATENPRIEVISVDDDTPMAIDDTSPLPSYSSPLTTQNCNEVSRELKRLRLDNTVTTYEKPCGNLLVTASTIMEGASNVAQNFALFAPLITEVLVIGKEILALYEKAEHNKEICSFLLQRCNCARAAVEDLNMRKTENISFFSKKENLELFKNFNKCMQRIKKFIADISQLNRLKKYFFANNIEDTFKKLINEFEGCMNSLNFSFSVQSRNEMMEVKHAIKQLTELLLNIHGADTAQSQHDFFNGLGLVTRKNKDFQKQNFRNNQIESNSVEEAEPLLDGSQFQKTNITRSKKIEKRTAYNNCDEFCFKEFSNNSSTSTLNQSNTQIEIRRQVNILKELKNSNHIIKFSGVAQENSKFYLVTEWMDHGNLYEYYTDFKDNMNWKTKIRFALDICRGVSYLNDCQILHHDIQSANILVNIDHKVKIANFGLSKKFSEFTRNISHNIENVRYMAPEKLLIEEDENNINAQGLPNDTQKRKKVPYDSKCEIYSVGALLWEIAELRKPHSDINSTEMLISIRDRVRKKYREPLSNDVPEIWKYLVKRAMEHEPQWRLRISEICFELYRLNEKFSDPFPRSPSYMSDDDENLIIDSPMISSQITVAILSVDDAIREHKSNGNKRLAWQSFKHHSKTNNEAKYWLGYYYYYAEIPELQQMNQEERHRIALNIFKETADIGNPSAQLRYGMHLWKISDYSEAIRYLEMSAKKGNSTAMYNIGSAYWNGNYVEEDKLKGAEYLKNAAMQNQPKAIDMCKACNIIFN